MSQRDLFLLRHAHAEPQAAGQSDFDRPLSKVGSEQATAAAAWLKARLGPQPRVLCSPARRTLQTAAALEAELGSLPVRTEPAIYEASPGTLLMLLDREADAASVLLVGHNPGLESAVALLSAGRSGEARGMPPAGIAHLRLPAGRGIEPGVAELVELWWP